MAAKIHHKINRYIPAVLAFAVEENELIAEVSSDVRSMAASSFPFARRWMATTKASAIPRTFIIPAIKGQRPSSNILLKNNMKIVWFIYYFALQKHLLSKFTTYSQGFRSTAT